MLNSPEVSKKEKDDGGDEGRFSSPPEGEGASSPHILLVGFNHHKSGVERLETIRENFRRVSLEGQAEVRKEVFGTGSKYVTEFVVISTCNRFEVCAVTSEVGRVLTNLVSSLRSLASYRKSETAAQTAPEDEIIVLKDREAVEHIFDVACAVDSLVIGERQILSQVKKTIVQAGEAGTASRILSELFFRAVRTGRALRISGAIPQNSNKELSVGWVATELVKNRILGTENPTVLLVGAGKMVVEALLSLQRELQDTGRRISIVIANRTISRANELAKKAIPFSSTAIPLDEVPSWLESVDAVVCATSSDEYVLKTEDLRKAITGGRVSNSKNRPLLVVDIGLPRNVEPSARSLEGVELWNLDDLKPFVKNKQRSVEGGLHPVHVFIQRESEDFIRWLEVESRAIPVIAALHKRGEMIRKQELRASLSKLPGISAKEREVIEILSKRIVNRILLYPTEKLKESVAKGDGESYTKAVRVLFSLKEREDEKEEYDGVKTSYT
jgi:glutamyl-tRNA reductase